jgi:hypothetical protein
MPDVTIYAVVDNQTPLTRAEWASALTALQAHPILQTINAGATQVANEASLTSFDDSTRYALLSFVLPSAIRPQLQGYASLTLGEPIADPLTQYSTIFTGIARMVLPQVTITLICHDEDYGTAVQAVHAYLIAHPEVFPVRVRPNGGE